MGRNLGSVLTMFIRQAFYIEPPLLSAAYSTLACNRERIEYTWLNEKLAPVIFPSSQRYISPYSCCLLRRCGGTHFFGPSALLLLAGGVATLGVT